METITTFYDNGQLKEIGKLADDKKNGLWVTYFEDGKIQFEVHYLNGLKHGSYKRWHSNGNVYLETFFEEGKAEGLWRDYYEDGHIREEDMYVKDIYKPLNFWDDKGEQTLINGTGFKIEKYGASEMDVYKQYFEKGEFIKEEKLSSRNIIGFDFPDQ